MFGGIRLSRRRVGQLVAAFLPMAARCARAQVFDQGLGGTGVVGDPKEESSDQTIGGTGVVGTIRRFGSIYVNGMRIAYPDDIPVSLAGAQVSAGHLALGQVVRVVAAPGAGGDLTARSIAILHEVVGPIEAVDAHRITVLGQAVSTEGLPASVALDVGRSVAVSGLRRLDGTIVASLVEAAPSGRVAVAGPLERSDGILRVGGLTVEGVDAGLVGRRVFLTGRLVGAALVATRAVTERATLAALGERRWMIEAYVARGASGLRLGSGLRVEGDVPVPTMDGPGIVILAFDKRERLIAEKVEAEVHVQSTTRQTQEKRRDTNTDAGTGEGRGSGRASGGRGGSRGR